MSFVQSIVYSIRQKSLLIKISHIYSFNPSALKRNLICSSCPVFSAVKTHPCSTAPAQQVPTTVDSLPLSAVLTLQTKIISAASPAAASKSSETPHLLLSKRKPSTFFICSKENAESWIHRYDLHVAFLVISTDAERLRGLVECLQMPVRKRRSRGRI